MASSSESIDSLRTRLEAKNDYFKRMVNLIPAKTYLDAEQEASQQTYDPQKKGKSEKAEEKGHKKGKQKRQRLDPKQKSITDIQVEKAEKKEMEVDDEEDSAGEDEDESDGDDDEKTKEQAKRMRPIRVENVQTNLTIDELREKLHSKIKEMKGKRKAADSDEGYQETKRQKRMEKKKMKKKKKEIIKNSARNAAVKSGNMNGPQIINKRTDMKPVTNNEGKVVFSKFDFSESNESKQKKKNKIKQTGKKKLELLLKQAEAKREKLSELKNTEPEKAKIQEQKQAWKKALERAEGSKQTDDPELLKKAIKRKEKMKVKSKKHWDERKDVTEKLMQKRQDKRKRNIKAKKQDRLQKKIKKMKKKGRILPGF